MKVLLVVPDTNIGGITSSVVNFTNELVCRGNEVFLLDMSGENLCSDKTDSRAHIISLKGKSKLWDIGMQTASQEKGIKKIGILLLGLIKKITIKSGLWYNLIFSPLKEYGEFDVAVAFRQCAPCYSFVLSSIKAKKKIGFVHGELKYMGDISSWQKYMSKFDKIAYVSNAVKTGFVKEIPYLEKNACVIYNMLNFEKIREMACQSNPIKFDSNCFNIVTVARITKQKQIDWIVKICADIKKSTDKKFHWYVVGDGYYLNEVKQMAKDLCVEDVLTFTGELSNPYPLMKYAQICVLTSRDESFGMVVVESLILKKPVIVAEYEALKEIISDEKYGIITPQSIDCLTEATLNMMNNENNVFFDAQNNLLNYEYSNDTPYQQFLDAVI